MSSNGFKALAYPASNLSDPISPCQCSLVFRCDDAAKKATVFLVAEVPTADGTKTFVLQYDADKLLTGSVSLTSGNKHVPLSQLNEVLRDKDDKRPQLKTLALSFKEPCPVWHPDSPYLAHRPGFEHSFQQFVDLTKATTIHIVFDYKYLRKDCQSMFKAFSRAAKGLTGHSVEGFITQLKLRKASWEIFSPVDVTGAPPAYDNFRKRSGQASLTSPPPKRFAPQSPAQSYTSEKTVPLSPTTADAIRTALSEVSSGFDYQAEAINAAVARQLAAYLEKALPILLPNILPTLFVSAPPSSNLSPPNTSHISQLSDLPPLTSLGHSLLLHLRTHLAEQFQQYRTHQYKRFQKLLDRLWDSAEGARAHETAEMMEEMEEHKADMMLLKEDAVKELSAEIDAVFAKERELSERLERVFVEMCDKIDRLKRTRLKKLVAFEVRKHERRRKCVPRGVGKSLIRGDQKLLGRKRDAEEWFDC